MNLIAEPKTAIFRYDAAPYVAKHGRSARLLWMRLAVRKPRLGHRWRKRMLVIDWWADHTPPEYGITCVWRDILFQLGYDFDDTEPHRITLARLCRRVAPPMKQRSVAGCWAAELDRGIAETIKGPTFSISEVIADIDAVLAEMANEESNEG